MRSGAVAISTLDRRFFGKHDWDVVADWIDALAVDALEAGAVLDELHGLLAKGANEDFQEIRCDRHAASLAQLRKLG
jgi:hypothetical protein